MLEIHGWQDGEDGLLLAPTTEHSTAVATLSPKLNRYAQIMELLKEGLKTNAEIRLQLNMKRPNVGFIRLKMIEQGLVSCLIPNKRPSIYQWVAEKSYIPPEALRQWEDRAGRYSREG